ncbi:MAG: glycoside hydrolase family 9 protein [Bacteroidales bacterium]|nr:glycoside hydrolase family 9 protein [Bacteroidales bacterium]
MGKKTLLAVLLLAISISSWAQDPAFKNEDYQKALWMTTRFYGAQRMGNGVNWLTHGLTWESAQDGGWLKRDRGHEGGYTTGKSFLKDSDDDYDLTGGWFDCGDHVLFGQTFYYSAYMLLLGYSEFQDGYGDNYSDDYHGYINSDDYTWEGKKGSPNGVADILDECRYATDFIMKAVRDNKTFYYQKGNGRFDHRNWATSVMMTSFNVSEGGEYDGKRNFAKATNGYTTSMTALAGAALAVMSRVSPDPEYSTNCLAKAKIAYEYVMNTNMGNSMDMESGEFYPAKPQYLNDITILCAELYRITKDSKYLDKCNEYTAKWIDTEWNHNFVLNYNNTQDLALYAYCAMGKGNKYTETCKAKLKQLTDNYPKTNNVLKISNGWGELRYNANAAFSIALYSKLADEPSVNEVVLRSVEYIMGSNSKKFSYIVGFDPNGGSNYPKNPHHRNFFRSDCGNEANAGASIGDISKYKYRQLGYMVGGSINDGYYVQTVSDQNYKYTEGGIDYNAGLVGALAYICSKTAVAKTVTSIKMEKTPKTTYMKGDALDVTGGTIKVTYSDNTTKLIAITKDMVKGFSSQAKNNNMTLTVTYEEKTTTYIVKIVELESIAWNTKPTKTQYAVNDKIDLTGGKINAKYSDGSTEAYALTNTGIKITGFDSSKGIAGQTITVTFGGKTLTYNIDVIKKPAKIEFTTDPKKEYIHKAKFDKTIGKLKLTYDDGTTNSNITLENANITLAGNSTATVTTGKVVTVSYKEASKTVTTTYKIDVKEAALNSITITKPTKLTYGVNEPLDVTGGKVNLKFADNCTKTINMTASMISGFKSDLGLDVDIPITVTYEGKTATFNIRVIRKATGIQISTMPVLGYQIGEEFDCGEGLLMVTYDDGTKNQAKITSDMIEGFDSSTPGIQTVTITTEGKSTSIKVTINKKPVNTIVVSSMPAKTDYYLGDELELDGAKIMITYSDNTSEVIDLTDEMIMKFAPQKAGQYKVTVSYGGKTTVFSVNMEEKPAPAPPQDDPEPIVPEEEKPAVNVDELPEIITATDIKPANSARIYSFGNTIYIEGLEGAIEIINVMGSKIFSGINPKEITISTPGIYIVKARGISQKVMIQ